MGMFCFPAGGVLPLHDHPGMTVLTKLLYGFVYVKAYDWVKVMNSGCQTFGLTSKAVDGIFKAPCEAFVLFPRSGGNIHSFTALTPCAILDVLSPPYSEELGRPSTYFSDFHIPSLPGYAMLEEKDLPDDLDNLVNKKHKNYVFYSLVGPMV
ncbi:plant cysteine oxidase 1-like [Juglans microcarpa x Juglans regia]|uniref:plant cysteine oxidase 1-like n=1 Tax=Juglans microcarpa x Juglans regia TaxID=2249226 RepID=UPI001B7DE533|nr:plant cysteine oxidase 1-like [Juglans microcarpa x Juglans regia]